MKINTENNIITSNLKNEAIAFKLNASPIAYKILSDGLYKNKIGSMIRELLSNAFDSEKEANNLVPIKVVLPSFMNQQFIIRDYGTGLSDAQMREIYTTYFLSTKSDNNKFIGGFGLGSKTPLCYNDEQFGVISYYNGVKTSYLVYVENGVPTLQEMLKEETTEHNGLEISIGVNKSDIETFRMELKKFIQWVPFEITVENNTDEYDYSQRKEKINVIDDIYMMASKYRGDYPTLHILINGIHYECSSNELFADTYENIVLKNLKEIKKRIKKYCGLDVTDKDIITRFSSKYDYGESFFNISNRVSVIFDLPIGTLDLTASRENIAYTERTRTEIISRYLALIFAAGYYPCKLFAENGWGKGKEFMDEKDMEIFKKCSKFMTIFFKENEWMYNRFGFSIPGLSFGNVYEYAHNYFYDDGKWKATFPTKYPEYYLPVDVSHGITVKFNNIKNNQVTNNPFYDSKHKIGVVMGENKPVNVILTNVTLNTFLSKHLVEDGDYLFVKTKKNLNSYIKLLENDLFTNYKIVNSVTTKINAPKKRKCMYDAYKLSRHGLVSYVFEKNDVVLEKHLAGKEIYYLPCKGIIKDKSTWKEEDLALLINRLYPELKQDEERLIVLVDETRLKIFEKHYPYAQPVLQNKKFAKAIKHIIYFWVDLGSPTDRDFYLNTQFDRYNSYGKQTKIFYRNWGSYKRYYDKNVEFCKWLETVSQGVDWYSVVRYCYSKEWYQYMQFLPDSYYFHEYHILNDTVSLVSILKGEKLVNYCLDVLTYEETNDIKKKEYFAKVIRNTKGY